MGGYKDGPCFACQEQKLSGTSICDHFYLSDVSPVCRSAVKQIRLAKIYAVLQGSASVNPLEFPPAFCLHEPTGNPALASCLADPCIH